MPKTAFKIRIKKKKRGCDWVVAKFTQLADTDKLFF